MASREEEQIVRRMMERGLSLEEIDRLASQPGQAAAPEPQAPPPLSLLERGNLAFQGLTGGASDEIQAGISSVFGDQTFANEQKRFEGILNEQRDRNPLGALGAELTGGLLGGIGGGLGVAKAFPRFAKQNPLLTGPTTGLLGGTAVGAASAPEGSRGFGAAIGAGIGGGLGLGMPLVFMSLPFVRSISRNLWHKASTPKAVLRAEKESRRIDKEAKRVAEKFRKTFRLDETSAARVQKRTEQLGEGATIAAAGGANVLALAEATAKQSGTARNRIVRQAAMNNRHKARRIMAPVERNLAKDGKSFDQTFGTDGKIIINVSDLEIRANGGVAITRSGKIIILGSTITGADQMIVAQLNNDGSVDTNFGMNGSTTIKIGTFLQDDGGMTIKS